MGTYESRSQTVGIGFAVQAELSRDELFLDGGVRQSRDARCAYGESALPIEPFEDRDLVRKHIGASDVVTSDGSDIICGPQ
jgi:hypothetical protein